MSPSLYIHIPFCMQKCDYCDFFSRPHSGKIPDAYVEALVAEENHYAQKYGVDFWKTIYLGGGTPGLLSPEQISHLFNKLSPRITKSTTEITMEMNPESISKEKLIAAQKSGVTRLSLGIQSLNNNALKAVNRHCTSEKAIESLALVKDIWKGKVNLDAIAGLPGQNEEEFLSSLSEIISFNPQHLSMYTLTIEEGTPLYKKIEEGKVKFNEDDANEQWIKGRKLLEENGYVQYEVSNFSKPGNESRHNMTYWMQEDYAGIGAGATGTFYDAESTRWTNTQNIEEYISFWNNADGVNINDIPRKIEKIDLETREFEFIMMGLRTTRGINSEEYINRFKKVLPWEGNLASRLGKDNGLWNQYTSENLTFEKKEKDGSTTYSMNPEGLMFLNNFLIQLL